MAQFTNTKRVDTINSITQTYKDRLNSPHNILLNLKPYVTNYWNQDIENSTSDPASNLIYEPVGEDSPLCFNMIEDAIMYGLPQLQLDLEIGEFGLESSYSGESTILPNTWIPYSGDFFTIQHSGSTRSFMVTSVSPDTLPNGANFYKIQYEYSTKLPEDLIKQTIGNYRFIFDNVGTQFSTVIKDSVYDDIAVLEDTLSTLKKYYNSLFFKDKVQTYVYQHDGYNFYDPYMIEFIDRNNILNDNKDFAYITQAIPLNKTFTIEYDRTFMRAVETCDKTVPFRNEGIGRGIDNKLSLFYYTSSEYFQIEYNSILYNPFAKAIPIIEPDLLDRIMNNTPYQPSEPGTYKNLIIGYFNNKHPSSIDILDIRNISFEDNIIIFYNIPILIYILEKYIKDSITSKPKMDISKQVTYK